DAHLISQAIANLLDNAIKYSPQGSTVLIAAEQSAEGPSVAIADRGPGIPAGKRAAILERFVRLEEAAGKEGFGLGLSFVAAVAEWHGARLELADNGPGLRVALYFPAARTRGDAAVSASAPSDAARRCWKRAPIRNPNASMEPTP